MAKKEGQINNTTATLMVATALFFDGIQALLALFMIGLILNRFVSLFAWLTFFVWFAVKGVKFVSKPKNLVVFGGGTLCEIIPVISALPAWTLSIAGIVAMNKLKT